MLREAARNTASWSIRNMGTVGGNLFTPPPGGDVAVALLALDARARLAGVNGERVLPLSDFYTGFMTTHWPRTSCSWRSSSRPRSARRPSSSSAGSTPTRPPW